MFDRKIVGIEQLEMNGSQKEADARTIKKKNGHKKRNRQGAKDHEVGLA